MPGMAALALVYRNLCFTRQGA